MSIIRTEQEWVKTFDETDELLGLWWNHTSLMKPNRNPGDECGTLQVLYAS
jgi:hypothetical protein